MLLWPMVLVGVLLLLFGAAWAYQSRARNASSPMQSRISPVLSIVPGLAFAMAGEVILIATIVRAVLTWISLPEN